MAPDLAVEVSSPSNLDDRSMEKVQAYIEAHPAQTEDAPAAAAGGA